MEGRLVDRIDGRGVVGVSLRCSSFFFLLKIGFCDDAGGCGEDARCWVRGQV